ncbi:MAG: 6,7-dimethyl-8-ribityllumazine synthase [Rhodospirillales bacterium]|jgi:6,7-dimethyl-8-ribityllumazine synthase|nr:6,7-dimethyl-8-ribityllumazine synthase [Rhodospirillales bacterium]
MTAEKPRVLIVEARFYEDISDELAKGVIAVLEKAGVGYERVEVPGTFEVPAAIRFAIQSASEDYAGFIALGCVIRGETDHYDHICREASRALMDISLDHCVAMGFGILTCEDRGQAWARAAVDRKNKGADAANACLRMMELQRDFRLVTQ